MNPPPFIPDHTVLRPIGKGAYGEVWLARNVMGVLRAVKFIWRARFESERPFEREFAGVQRYEPVSRSADGLVHVLHVGRKEAEGCFYYVMELADAVPASPTEPPREAQDVEPDTYVPRTLRSDLQHGRRLSTADCLRLALDIVSGLAQLHRQGLVHRDVKPANIIFVGGRAKLADIGLVAADGEGRTFVGTEGYIAPEGPGTPAGDLYALGIALYEASTGLHREQFPDVPREWLETGTGDGALELHEIILKASEAQPERRYRSADELQADVALLQSGQSIRRVRTLERRIKRLRRVALAIGLLVAIALVGWSISTYRAELAANSRARETALRQEAEDALFKSRLAQAHASRRSGRVGQHYESLAAIRNAARLKPGSPELRDEAIAALATVDLREAWRRPMVALVHQQGVAMDGAMRWLAEATNQFLVRLQNRESGAIAGVVPAGPGAIRTVGPFSPGGDLLRILYETGDYWVWNLKDYRPVIRNPGILFRDGGGFARGGLIDVMHSGAVIWQSLDGQSNRTLTRIAGEGLTALPSPDGSWLGYSSPNGRHFTVVELDRGETNACLLAPEGEHFKRVAWSRDGQWLALDSSDFLIRVWALRKQCALMATLRGHVAEVAALAFHPDGRLLASSSWDGNTRLWDWAGERCLLISDLVGPRLWFSDDGTRLTLRDRESSGGTSFVGQEIAWPTVCQTIREERPPRRPGRYKGPWRAAFSPDGRWLATATWDGVRFYDAGTGQFVARLDGQANSVCFAGAPLELWFGGEKGGGRIPWPGDPALLRPLQVEPVGSNTTFISSSRDGSVVARTGGKGVVRVSRSGNPPVVCDAAVESTSITVSPDGTWVAGGCLYSNDHYAVTLWRANDGSRHLSLPASRRPGFQFSPDSKQIAVGSAGDVAVWDVASGRRCWSLPRTSDSNRSGQVAFSADSRVLAASFSMRVVTLLSPADGRVLARLEAPPLSAIMSLVFSPDGSQLAVMLEDHEWQLWDLRRLRRELAALGLDWQE